MYYVPDVLERSLIRECFEFLQNVNVLSFDTLLFFSAAFNSDWPRCIPAFDRNDIQPVWRKQPLTNDVAHFYFTVNESVVGLECGERSYCFIRASCVSC